jgi:hypothetical protein
VQRAHGRDESDFALFRAPCAYFFNRLEDIHAIKLRIPRGGAKARRTAFGQDGQEC